MKTHTIRNLLVMVIGFSLWTHTADTRAETVNCTAITSLPTTISAAGVYCLKKDLTAPSPLSFSAITISSDNVVLDLNGFTLTGTGPQVSHDVGISCTQCRNVTVKNGTIAGFNAGIELGQLLPSRCRNNVIEDIRAVRQTRVGILAAGASILVRNNLVLQTHGDTTSAEYHGIAVQGVGIRVLNNDVSAVRHPNGTGAAIDIVTGGEFTRPANNFAVNNRISNADLGIRFFESEGKYRDNITLDVTTPYIGGTDIGDNF